MSTCLGGLRRWPLRLLTASALVVLVWAVAALVIGTHEPSSSALAVAISLNTDGTGHLPWQSAIVITARGGRLQQVTINDSDRLSVSGSVDRAGTRWHSTTPLVPDLTYAVGAKLVDAFGRAYVRTARITTTPPKVRVDATITPGDGDVVGIGMPIVLRFDHDVEPAKRTALMKRLRVDAIPATVGAWRWISPRQLHWRPQQFWAADSAVTAIADLSHLDLGGGDWAIATHVAHFRIGDAHESVADASTHTMVVSNNGHPVRTLPISAGRQAYPSRNGVHIALSKDAVVTMDSATVGIPHNSPDGYFEKVQWDVRISYAGAFVHAAPWSVADQGQRNVSHGCINLSNTDAQWFYGFTLRGDVIEIHNAGAPPDLADPGTADWNLSWDAWRQA